MKPLFLIVIAACLAFLSCNKSDSTVVVVVPPVDSIYFHDIIPDTTFTSADTFVLHGSGTFWYADPLDSSASYSLDADRDGHDDLTFTVYHFYDAISASNPVCNHNYAMKFTGTDTNSKIKLTDDSMYPVADALPDSGIIDTSGTYAQSSWIMMGIYLAPFSCDFSNDRYIGFRITKDGKTRFGWVLVRKNAFSLSMQGFNLTVKEWAVSEISGIPIRAGQRI